MGNEWVRIGGVKYGCGRIGFRADHEDEYGDVAIDMVLNAYERVLKEWPHPDRRHRIEHCSPINPDLIRRIKATGSIPTPFWTYIHYHGEKWRAYCDERMRSMCRGK